MQSLEDTADNRTAVAEEHGGFSVAANTGRNEVFGAGSLFSEAANAETVADGKIFAGYTGERSPKVQVLQLT